MENETYANEVYLDSLSSLFEISLAFVDGRVVLKEDTSYKLDDIQIQKGDSLFEFLLMKQPKFLRSIHLKFYKETIYSKKFFDILFKLDEDNQATVFHYLFSLSKSKATLLCELKKYGYESQAESEIFKRCLKTFEEQINSEKSGHELSSMFQSPQRVSVSGIISSPDALRKTLKSDDLDRFDQILENMNSPKSKNQEPQDLNKVFGSVVQSNIISGIAFLAVIVGFWYRFQGDDTSPKPGR